MTRSEQLAQLHDFTCDAYSYDRYGESGWRGCIRLLLNRGYTPQQTEAILRSKWTRWAGDGARSRDGYCTGADLGRFLDAYRGPLAADVAELVANTETHFDEALP
jgi:hypothetical protein